MASTAEPSDVAESLLARVGVPGTFHEVVVRNPDEAGRIGERATGLATGFDHNRARTLLGNRKRCGQTGAPTSDYHDINFIVLDHAVLPSATDAMP
jgi:hypothetical protein